MRGVNMYLSVRTSKASKELKVVLPWTPPFARKRIDDSQIYLHSTRGFSHG
jgi:hypothetical protein